jgi:predicted ArsR family transcriptional regulator
MLCQGESPKDIAAKLEISVNTAHTHVRNLASKAGVVGDRQLILYSMQQPQAMRPGRFCRPGLHAPLPECTCPYCLAMLVAA